MILDLNKLDPGFFGDQQYDVCICGAGVAGITLARKLSENLNVLLLEAGDEIYSAESYDVYRGSQSGRQYYALTETRLRFFGGTSNHWAGMCRTLDAHDFETKSYAEYSGWPIKQDALNPYLDEAKFILGIDQQSNNNGKRPDSFRSRATKLNGFNRVTFAFNPPVRFAIKYKDELKKRKNIHCVLNANLLDIQLHKNLEKVKQIEIANYQKQPFKVKTSLLVLATGGLENPKILLNCNKQIKTGLGNQQDLVGRFFSEHLHHEVGHFILTDNFKKHIYRSRRAFMRAKRFFSPTPGMIKKDEILNFGLRFLPRKPRASKNYDQQLKAIACNNALNQSPLNVLDTDSLSECHYDGRLEIASEQTPNPSSRISLTPDRDQFGHQRLNLHWQLSDLDKHTMHKAVMRFGVEFARQELGRIRVKDWLIDAGNIQPPGLGADEVGGHHHMCTTRMADSAKTGVVDKNQKVFGIENLYIAGSSVFSTVGHANPTFTIVQMTLRLADHINNLHRS